MPMKAPRICQCGRVVPYGARCACRAASDKERKARFDQTRPSARARGYTKEWEQERTAFLRINSKCRRCGGHAAIVHHIIPHRGDKKLFWDRSNWMPVCKPCHDGPLQSAERRGVGLNFAPHQGTGALSTAQYLPKMDFQRRCR